MSELLKAPGHKIPRIKCHGDEDRREGSSLVMRDLRKVSSLLLLTVGGRTFN